MRWDGAPEVIHEVHAASTGGWRAGRTGWTLHRLMDAFRRVCETVAHAHARGVIHRDLKPENVMTGDFGEVLVLDWGLAKRLGTAELGGVSSGRSGQTRIGTVIGTPAYMSPEQARGETDRLDARSDVFSLGSILYEILTGRPPYDGHLEDVLADVAHGAPVAEPAGPGPLPEELVSLWRVAMARDPSERPADAGELATGLIEWQEAPAAESGRWCWWPRRGTCCPGPRSYGRGPRSGVSRPDVRVRR